MLRLLFCLCTLSSSTDDYHDWMISIHPDNRQDFVPYIKSIVNETKDTVFAIVVFDFPIGLNNLVITKSPYIKPADQFASKSFLDKLQFHIRNSGNNGGIAGEDINITQAWVNGYNGTGVHITVIDNGCYGNHSDLINKFDWSHSWSYTDICDNVNKSNIPLECKNVEPSQGSYGHGTTMVSVIAGDVDSNCGIGIAFNSTVSCFKYLPQNNSIKRLYDMIMRSNSITDIKLYSLNNRCFLDENDIPRCHVETHFNDISNALHSASTKGRKGLGVIFVLSAGNDGHNGGDVQFSAIHRDRHCIVVGSTTDRGSRAFYSNRGTSILVNAPSTGFYHPFDDDNGISQISTAFGPDPKSCYKKQTGTSYSSAMVAGVIAIILQANPQLSWRDIQYILALTATHNDPNCPSWQVNSNQIWYSSFYGFGRINAGLAIEAAKNWTKLDPESSVSFYSSEVFTIKPCLQNPLEIPLYMESGVSFVEAVELSFTLSDDVFSTLRVTLESPSSTMSILKLPSINVMNGGAGKKVFLARDFFGESSEGMWTLEVFNTGCTPTATISKISFTIYGCSSYPKLPSIVSSTGPDPFLPNEHSILQIIPPNQPIQCLSSFSLHITVPGYLIGQPAIVSVVNKKTNRPFMLQQTIVTETIEDLVLPCIFDPRTEFLISLEIPSKGIIANAPITIKTQHNEEGVLYPRRFSTIRTSDTQDTILPIKYQLYIRDTPSNYFGSMATLSLIDYPMNITRQFHYIKNTGNATLTLKPGERCYNCLIVISSMFHTNPIFCSSLVQPISIVGSAEAEISDFPFSVRDECKYYSANELRVSYYQPKVFLYVVYLSMTISSIIFIFSRFSS